VFPAKLKFNPFPAAFLQK